jgi:hypothetical protein
MRDNNMRGDYPPLFREYIEFCNYRDNLLGKDGHDLNVEGELYPTTLLLMLESLHYKYPKKGDVSKIGNLGLYLSGLSTDQRGKETTENIVKATRFDGTYVEKIYEICSSKGLDGKNVQAIKYVTSELIANIFEHSKCNSSAFMAEAYKRSGFVEVAFFDNGITIPGSFADAGIRRTDQECIKESVTGTSTKPEGGRGHGLPSTISILKAINCDILIVSRNAALYINGTNKYLKEDIIYELDDLSKLEGTLVSFQAYFPTKTVNIFEGGYL